MSDKDMATGWKPFCDKDGLDFRRAWAQHNFNDLAIQQCAKAIEEVALAYPHPGEPLHPLECLAVLARSLKGIDTPEDPMSKACFLIVKHAWRLAPEEFMMIAQWAQVLAQQARAQHEVK